MSSALNSIVNLGGWLFGSGGSTQNTGTSGSSSATGSTSQSGTTTRQTQLDTNQILSMIDTTLKRQGLGQLFADQAAGGLYGSTGTGFLANDMITNAVMQASIAGAKTTETTQNNATQTQNVQSVQNQRVDNSGSRGVVGNLFRGVRRLFRSDRSVKENIERIGTTSKGYPLYSFTYKDTKEPGIGVMHDEVPASARVKVGGTWYVDYNKVM